MLRQAYEKYLLMKLDDMKNILKTLPTNIIERSLMVLNFDVGFDISKLDESNLVLVCMDIQK